MRAGRHATGGTAEGAARGDDPLRLQVCLDCAYALTGLPPAGNCPECGRRYDQQTVVLYGFARGRHAHVGNAPPRLVVRLAAAPAVPLLAAVAVLTGWAALWLVPLAALLWAALVWAVLWRRGANKFPGPVEVRLCRTGCCQFDDVAQRGRQDPRLTPWPAIRPDGVLLKPAAPGRFRLRLRATSWTPVDAEVICDARQAAALRDRIARWRSSPTLVYVRN